jgi:hypothetical protein
MAAAKKRAAKKAPKDPVVEGPFDEDGEPDVDGSVARATFDPTTHGVFSIEYVQSLSAARGEESVAEARAIKADSDRLSAIFTGIGESQSADRDEIKRLRVKLDDKDRSLDDYRDKLEAKGREIAELMSAREEAKLERERLQHDIATKELAIQHLQTVKGYELEVRRSELATLKEIGAPAAMAIADGLGAFIQSKVPGLPGTPKVGGLPGGTPTTQPSAQPGAPSPGSTGGVTYAPAVISLEETEAWSEAFLNVYRRQGPVGIAHIRAALCSLFPGTPPFPKTTRELITVVYSEAGEEPLQRLMHLTSHAYKPEPPPAQAGNGAPASP